MERVRGTGARAIQGDSPLIPKAPATVEQVVLGQARTDLEKDGVAMAWGNRIEEGAHLVVTGNLLDAKQGLGVMAPLPGLELALGLQKRWRWREAEAKGASGRVLHRVTGMGAGLTVGRKVRDALVQARLESIEA
jgi:hypothetical protein